MNVKVAEATLFVVCTVIQWRAGASGRAAVWRRTTGLTEVLSPAEAWITEDRGMQEPETWTRASSVANVFEKCIHYCKCRCLHDAKVDPNQSLLSSGQNRSDWHTDNTHIISLFNSLIVWSWQETCREDGASLRWSSQEQMQWSTPHVQ